MKQLIHLFLALLSNRSFMKEEYIKLVQQNFAPLLITPNDHELAFKHWEDVSFERGDFITEAGKIERYLYLVVEGVQTLYLISSAGNKQVIAFSFDGSFSGVYDSFLKECPSHYFLEALTPTRLLRINKSTYDSLFEHYPEFNKWGRIAHQEILIGRVQREIELVTMSARERFDIFMDRCPEPLLQIPQKYLASYLNMTPETFSRLRAKIS